MSIPPKDGRWRAILAATLIPAAVVFALPGLTEGWYVKAGDQDATKNDPHLLMSGQIFGATLNIMAAIAFAFRLVGFGVDSMTVLSISGLVGAIVVDALALSIFGATHANSRHDGYVLSTAFFLTVTSGIFSVLALLALLMDYCNFRHDPAHYLTPKQRSLSLMSFVFMAYLSVGSLIYKFMLHRSYLDSMYFLLSSILTVGYGDVQPSNLPAKIVSIIYLPFGIIIIGILISLIRETVLASVDKRIRRRLLEQQAMRKEKRSAQTTNTNAAQEVVTGWDNDTPTSARAKSYEQSLRDGVTCAARSSYMREIGLVFALFVVFWIVGTVVYMRLEGWSFFISFYFTFMTYTVIGYGDYSPVTTGGRAFYIGWGVIGIIILTMLFSLIGEVWSNSFADSMRMRVANCSRKFRDRNAPPDPGPIIVPVESKNIGLYRLFDASRGLITSFLGSITLGRDSASLTTTVAAGASFAGTSVLESAMSRMPIVEVSRGPAQIIQDCEHYLKLVTRGDYDSIRDILTHVLLARDGIERDVHNERILLNQDPDDVVAGMLLKHVTYELHAVRSLQCPTSVLDNTSQSSSNLPSPSAEAEILERPALQPTSGSSTNA